MKKIALLGVFLLFLCSSEAQLVPASYQIGGSMLNNLIMYPKDYSDKKSYPLLVFLHGAGERGNDNLKQLANGKMFLTDNFQEKYPAIVIAPQCPEDEYWANVERHQIGDRISFNFHVGNEISRPMSLLVDLVNNWVNSGKVDKSRVYVGGLSMGGMGTLELLWRMPHIFAAAFAICGGVNQTKLPLFAKNTAVWLFHGDADVVVSVDNSRNTFKNLKKLGCDVKYSEYKGMNHNSWDSAFVEKNLPEWLFSHRLFLKKN